MPLRRWWHPPRFSARRQRIHHSSDDVLNELIPARWGLVVRKESSDGLDQLGWASVTVSGAAHLGSAFDFPAQGMLLRLDDPLVLDVASVVGFTLSMGEVGDASIELNAQVLPGTTAGWAGTAYPPR